MKQSAFHKIVRLLALVVLAAPLVPVSAGSAKRAIRGDWRLQIDVDGQQLPSVLSLSRNADGSLKGEWLCFWGITELREIKYEDRQLSFAMTIRLTQDSPDLSSRASCRGFSQTIWANTRPGADVSEGYRWRPEHGKQSSRWAIGNSPPTSS